MKLINILTLLVAITAISFGCKKSGDDDGAPCENNNTTKVTFTNTSAAPVVVVLAERFDAGYNPVNVQFTVEIAPGASAIKEFTYGRVYFQWQLKTCPSPCTSSVVFSRTYDLCQEYTESF